MDIVTSTPESELLQALQEALAGLETEDAEPDTITSSEFAAALGLQQNAAQRRLKKLMAPASSSPSWSSGRTPGATRARRRATGW